MSLKTDQELIGMNETESLARCAFDSKCRKIIEALIEGDDAEAGRILRIELEYLVRDEANAISDEPDISAEILEATRKDSLREMMRETALIRGLVI